ncbi:MAG: hypothetical protein ACI849_000570 [Patiriisocius sp.]
MRNFLLILSFISCFVLQAQEQNNTFSVDANYFYGSILRHNKDLEHLIKGHPQGFILGYNVKTYGAERWQQAYNYPDFGVSMVYQNPQNDVLGSTIGIHGHYNFYFLKRNIFLRLATGIAYAENPFDIDENPKNNAYGTHIMGSTYFMLGYNKQNIFRGFGVKAGLSLIHYSNSSVKSPNTSANTFAATVGLTYEIDADKEPSYIKSERFEKITEPLHYNVVVRGGVSEGSVIGLGQKPFIVLSGYADKRLSFKSSIQLGVDLIFSKFLETEIAYNAAAFPNSGVTGDEDYKRVGIFAGYELHVNRLSLIGQVGYYVYYPYDYEGRIYLRPGLKYYISKKVFAVVTLKSHWAKAENVAFGVGFRI